MKVYQYENCDSCRRALKFLDKNGVRYERISIVERPPTKDELRRVLKAQGGQLRKLFNVSGQAYRELNLGARLDSMTEEQALELLSINGKLVKRPFVVGDKLGLVGFDEDRWKSELL
jgi:arsenate reductase (glutaredoxin)